MCNPFIRCKISKFRFRKPFWVLKLRQVGVFALLGHTFPLVQCWEHSWRVGFCLSFRAHDFLLLHWGRRRAGRQGGTLSAHVPPRAPVAVFIRETGVGEGLRTPHAVHQFSPCAWAREFPLVHRRLSLSNSRLCRRVRMVSRENPRPRKSQTPQRRIRACCRCTMMFDSSPVQPVQGWRTVRRQR